MNTRTQGTRLVLLLALLTGACAKAGPRVEITKRRTATVASHPVVPGAGPAERFGGMDMGAPDSGSDELDDLAQAIAYDLPSGWKELARNRERLVNLQPAGAAEASCYLSFLGGSASGLESNVNRWRKQFDQPPLTAEEVQALPKHPLFGRDATLVDVSGTFQGMGEGTPRPGYRLLGLAVCESSGSLFLKFSAPDALVEAEREHFLDLASSLRIDESHARPTDDGGATDGALSWTAPNGWVKGPPRAMREVTFVLGDGECYVTRLGGEASGMLANLNRWCGQFGRPALSPADVEALPHVDTLGRSLPVLQLTGSFQGMDGVTRDGQAMLGVACCSAQESFFVKLVGPEVLVQGERANFLAFVASLKEGP